jgi:PKD repeat protein
MGKHRGRQVGSVRQIGLLLLALILVASLTFGVARAGDKSVRLGAATAKPLLGLTGNEARFQSQTGQSSSVRHAFLHWEQGFTWGSPFAALFPTLAPIPMLHVGTEGRGKPEAITPADIAAGKGDGYLLALNKAIAIWNKGIYVRPLGEMNNSATLWSGYRADGQPKDAAHSTATYRKAFARIYVILHGGSASSVNAKLRQLGLPPVDGELFSNPFPRLRIVWSPLASDEPRVAGNAAQQYYPGRGYVDVEGGDIYDERLTDTAPWQGLETLYSVARSRGKPFSVPEWGLSDVDDPAFVQHMCTFLKTHATEVAIFYESRPGSRYDLASKPKSRDAYRECVTPLAGNLPPWAAGNAAGGGAKVIALKLTASPGSGLDVQFSISARLSVPIAHWQLVFGDGSDAEGAGPPPATVPHEYALDGTYVATLIVYASPPFTPESGGFLTSAEVIAGTGGSGPLAFTPTPAAGTAPLAVSFRTILDFGAGATSWHIVWGDGIARQGSGAPPRFLGHTFASAGSYSVLLIVNATGGRQFLARTVIAVAPPGAVSGTPTGRVLLNGRPFAGGPVPFGRRVDVTNGTLRLTTNTGTLTVSGRGTVAIFVLVRGTDRGRPIVELRLAGGDFKTCGPSRAPAGFAAPSPPPKVVRHLWAKGKGKYRTRGRYAAATIRGTEWLTADRCDGTLVRVTQGRVEVLDLPRRRTVLVRAGRSYLARTP